MKYAVAAILILAAQTAAAAVQTYTIDPNHSMQTFRFRHLGLSFAQGRFDKTGGSIMLDQAKHTGSADITIDVGSINTGVAKLDDELRSAKFFDAAKYPAITFKSTSFKFKGDVVTQVKGDLTVHGVTKPVELKVVNFVCTEHPMMKVPACAANAHTSISRSAFGISGYVPAVADEIELNLEVEATQAPMNK